MTPNTQTLDVEKMNIFIKQTHLTGANVSRLLFFCSPTFIGVCK